MEEGGIASGLFDTTNTGHGTSMSAIPCGAFRTNPSTLISVYHGPKITFFRMVSWQIGTFCADLTL